MNIAIRFFLGYFLMVGLAAWFVLNIFTREVEPGIRQATEDTLVDTANLLAEVAADELISGGIASGRFASAVDRAMAREPGASIWGVDKDSVDLRIYLTDAIGRVVFDSDGSAVGADYSRWRDVARVLRGEYGARSTRDDPATPDSSTMYVAAPVLRSGELLGVLSVAKPAAAMGPYSERAVDRVRSAGGLLVALSALIGLAITLWLTWSLNRLRDYARAVAEGHKAVAPTVGGGQLSELARALAHMRERLDGKHYVEDYVQSLAHELKSPLSAIRGAAEVLAEDPPPEERRRFVGNVAEQSERMTLIIERLLALARVEQLQAPEAESEIALVELAEGVLASRTERISERGVVAHVDGDRQQRLRGDRFLLEQALGNLLDNAIEFSPEGAAITIGVARDGDRLRLSVSDQGPGAPDYARAQLFERFYSLPRPATGRKSTGLGLPLVSEVAQIHGGRAFFDNLAGGARAGIELPVTRSRRRARA